MNESLILGHTALQGPLAGQLWVTPCMAHDGPYRLSLGPAWPESALLFMVYRLARLIQQFLCGREHLDKAIVRIESIS